MVITMKIKVAVALLALATSPDLRAQESESDSPAFISWFNEFAQRNAAEAMARNAAAGGPGPGTYTVTSIDELEAPDAVKNYFRRGAERRRAGTLVVPAGSIPSVSSLILRTPRRVLSDAQLVSRLPVPPSDISATPLHDAKLINTSWCGTRSGLKATGVSRIYVLSARRGIVEFCEESYRASLGAKIQVFKEELNATVGGTPATAFAERSADGRGRATLYWVTAEKSYELTAHTDDGATVEQAAAVLMRIAEGLRPAR